MKPVVLIESNAALAELAQELVHEPKIAVDTESNGFYAYVEKICLLQLSTRDHDYIIDPIKIEDLSPLRKVFEHSRVEKIFHAASNDIMGLKRDFQLCVVNLFDTSVAAKMLGYQNLGLAALLEHSFGIHLSKKLQRHNWAHRPLGHDELDYARLDTHFLIPLRDKFALELEWRELMDEARQCFLKVCDQEVQRKPFRPQDYLHIKGARSLDVHGKRILRALFIHREHEAKRRNRAPFRVLSNEAMLRLAQQRPKDLDDMSRLKGIPKNYRKGKNAQTLLQLVGKNIKTEKS